MKIKEWADNPKVGITSLLFFLAIFLLGGLSQSNFLFSRDSMGITVELKEWLILEVRTPSETLKTEGSLNCQIASQLNLDNNPVNIHVLLSVAKNQAVELRIQALGDLANSQGHTLPISDVGWKGSGEGFLSGKLSKNESEIMARWVGSGSYQGTIHYYYLNGSSLKGDYFQRVIYSLATL